MGEKKVWGGKLITKNYLVILRKNITQAKFETALFFEDKKRTALTKNAVHV